MNDKVITNYIRETLSGANTQQTLVMNQPEQVAFDLGRATALQARSKTENPYIPVSETEQHDAWINGYNSVYEG